MSQYWTTLPPPPSSPQKENKQKKKEKMHGAWTLNGWISRFIHVLTITFFGLKGSSEHKSDDEGSHTRRIHFIVMYDLDIINLVQSV